MQDCRTGQTPISPPAEPGGYLVNLTSEFGNPSSEGHAYGRGARAAVEDARASVAKLIGAQPNEMIFTSGATESCNLAVKGVTQMYRRNGSHIVSNLIEHPAVLEPCKRIEQQGLGVTWLKPDGYGRIAANQVAGAITPRTILVSIMAANNVIGVINPIPEIDKVTKAQGIMLHCDATQAAGKVPLDVELMEVDLLSLSAHKMDGPKGTGALYVRGNRPRVRLTPQNDGGGQERGFRSGTLNVPAIVGFGAACQLRLAEMQTDAARVAAMRDRLQAGLSGRLRDVQLNGHPDERLPNTLNVSFGGLDAESIIVRLPNIAVSTGAACSGDPATTDRVLVAIGATPNRARSSIRFSLGPTNTVDEVDYVIERVVRVVQDLEERRDAPRAATLTG